MKIKQGVTIHGLTPQIVLGVLAAFEEYVKYGTELVITSGNDGTHAVNSKHYSGNAVDIRTHSLPNPRQDGQAIANILNDNLGRDYDIIFEGDHIHIEYDPRKPTI